MAQFEYKKRYSKYFMLLVNTQVLPLIIHIYIWDNF